MSFKVTISETKEVETLTPREWVKGGPDGKGESSSGEYGYTPQIPVKATKTTTIFEIVTETLDLPRVATVIFGSSFEGNGVK